MGRPSASLLIASKSELSADDYDYRILLFKRTEHTAYMADHCVFPGGAFEESADESLEWLTYFREFGITEAQLYQLEINGTKRPAPLLTSGRNFSRDISMRLTALRETFEEIGVLICLERHMVENLQVDNSSVHTFKFNDVDLAHWQQAVHNDASQFLRMCRHFNVVPDLWSISEWSVWRSPATASKKYDTVFYFVALDAQPKMLLEPSEVDEAHWLTPPECLELFTAAKIWLAPIQYYEIARLTHMHQFRALADFASNRNKVGTTLLLPVYYRCDEAMVGTLPGDDLYPPNPDDFTDTIIVSGTLNQFRKRAKRLHRFIFQGMHDTKVELNFEPLDNHLNPVPECVVRIPNKL